eukprot:Mycagemm_TRINITY_DN8080_c0_g1::TRINITY_DN8080_c0_g1_i1::g.4499::m.4499 type:complete len:209 gc:universal TRINITY_DN8080_c0_g1_i1:76-702(+)
MEQSELLPTERGVANVRGAEHFLGGVSRAGSPNPWTSRSTDDSPSISDMSAKTRKRKQVRLACTNCRKNHTACDNARPCKRCVAADETHLCSDAPKRSKNKRCFPPSRASQTSGSASVEGSSDEEHEHSDAESAYHSIIPANFRRRLSSPTTSSAFGSLPSSTRTSFSSTVCFIADPEAAFRDETDYLSSLYLLELSRRAAIEVSEGC